MNERQLLQLKEEIQENRTRKSELEGSLKTIKSSLKEKYGVSSIADLQKKAGKLQKKYDSLVQKIEVSLDEIEEAYGD